MTRRSLTVVGLTLAAGAWMLAASVAAAGPAQLAPFKDTLFAYPPLTAILDDGARLDVDYSEARDIDERDEIPERRVKSDYVDLAPLRSQEERVVDMSAGSVRTMMVGAADQPTSIVLFVHGRNGDRRLGMNDRTFGGNFNRLKNLMSRSGGLYVTVDAGQFSAGDAARVGGLIQALSRAHPGASLVLACASMGGEFCWDLTGDAETLKGVAGIVMLSANNDPAKVAHMRAAAGERRIPLLLAHGTRDKVFAWSGAEALYERLRKESYPVRFVSFDGGNHGTPIRMIDWRATLNWMFQAMG